VRIDETRLFPPELSHLIAEYALCFGVRRGAGPGAFREASQAEAKGDRKAAADDQSDSDGTGGVRSVRCVHTEGWCWLLANESFAGTPRRWALQIDHNPSEYIFEFGLTRHTPADYAAARTACGDSKGQLYKWANGLAPGPSPHKWLVNLQSAASLFITTVTGTVAADITAAADADAALSIACADVVAAGGADGVSGGTRISVSSANS
jgi:hypothetical protein